jgi:hypothetical protein
LHANLVALRFAGSYGHVAACPRVEELLRGEWATRRDHRDEGQKGENQSLTHV